MNRWWDPEEPGVGVSVSDLVLLQPGEDPVHDLGAALFAVHRVGAAACLAAADVPLMTEHTLAEHLVTARASFAAPVVESVSKSLGDPTYAGLLVRDVADDAERGAVELFRSAVAKGVAAPLAAQRVAMVYGVPADRLGPFRGLACTPAAQPVALKDSADRVLFSYVENIAKAEMEDVSKATMLATRQWVETEHPRTTTGEFAPKGMSLLERLKQEQEAQPKPEERVQRKQRTQRQQRVQRQQRAEAKPAIELTQQQRSYMRSMRSAIATRRTSASALREHVRNIPPADRGEYPPFSEIMAQLPDDGGWQPLNTQEGISLFLTTNEMSHFDAAVEDAGGFRMGRLVEVAGDPEFKERKGKPSKITDAFSRHDDESEGEATNDEGIEPFSILVYDEQRDEAGSDKITRDILQVSDEAQAGPGRIGVPQDAWVAATHVLAREYLKHEGIEESDPRFTEIYLDITHNSDKSVLNLPDRQGRGDHFVYLPMLDNGKRVEVPALNEIRVMYGNVRGEAASERGLGTTPRGKEVELDPNQVYQLLTHEPSAGEHHAYWDEQAGSVVKIHHVQPKRDHRYDEPPDDDAFDEPIDPFEKAYTEIGKATALATREWVETEHPRARTGEFVRTGDPFPTFAQHAARRAERTQRKQRAQRAQRTQRVQQQATPASHRQQQRALARGKRSQQRVPATRSLLRAFERFDGSVPPGKYYVLDGNSFDALRDESLHSGSASEMRPPVIHVNPDATPYFTAAPHHDSPEEAKHEVISIAEDVSDNEGANEYDWLNDTDAEIRMPEHLDAAGADKFVKQKVMEYFAMHPEHHEIRVYTVHDPHVGTIINLYGLHDESRPVIIRTEVDDWSKPLTLRKVPVPYSYADDFVERWSSTEGDVTTKVYNRPIHDAYVLKNRTSGQSLQDRG